MYTAIVGLVMLAAFLEWFLWIAAFMYCLVKVFIKAEHWTVRILAIVIGIVFLLLRYAFALTPPCHELHMHPTTGDCSSDQVRRIGLFSSPL